MGVIFMHAHGEKWEVSLTPAPHKIYFAVFEDCEDNICENEAGCKLLAGDYICECPPEYTGAFCEEKGK